MHLQAYIWTEQQRAGKVTKLLHVSTCAPFDTRRYETCLFDELTGESEVIAVYADQREAEIGHAAATAAARFTLEPHNRLGRD